MESCGDAMLYPPAACLYWTCCAANPLSNPRTWLVPDPIRLEGCGDKKSGPSGVRGRLWAQGETSCR